MDVSLELPKLQISLFQCGIADHFSSLPDVERVQAVSTNVCLVLVDKTTIQSINDSEQNVWPGIALNCSNVTAQLLHLVDKSDAEFLAARTPFRSKVSSIFEDWKSPEVVKIATYIDYFE